MTPEERADRIILRTQDLGIIHCGVLRSRIIEEIKGALAEAKAEEERVWQETLRLIHRERG